MQKETHMAPAADPSASPTIHASENNLQPFYVLHKSSAPRKSAAKSRRRIELFPQASDCSSDEYSDNHRFETFKFLWSQMESTIMEALRNLNSEVYDKIDKWISESFGAIGACRKLDFRSATRPYPILNDASISTSVASRQIFTGLLFTKNIEFVDDILTFTDLGEHLRNRGCYVANLTSLDFTAKNGIDGCLKTLLRQFLMVSVDAPDISVLASWFTEKGNTDSPLVVIIDDVDRCCDSVLTDFIIMLREWVIKIPIILILGVATTADALRNNLSSNACSYLSLSEFTLGTPAQRMDAVIEAVLLKNSDGFGIGKEVSCFLRNYFLRHDGTLTLFIKSLKISMAQHVYGAPLSFALRKLVEEDGKSFNCESSLLPETMVKHMLEVPSFQRYSESMETCNDWVQGLSKLKRFRKIWSFAVMCLHEIGKYHKISLLDLYCEMLGPELRNSTASDQFQVAKDHRTFSYDHPPSGCMQREALVHRPIQITRNLPAVDLFKVLKKWEMLSSGISEVQEKLKELQSLKTSEENQSKRNMTEASRRTATRKNSSGNMDEPTINEKVTAFLECMIREHRQPIESIPLHEIFIFTDVDKLQRALIGDPRRRIQADLLESQKFLRCSCCSKNDTGILPSMHDTSIMYSLAQEHGDLINLHEWFHSFKAIISAPPLPAKQRSRLSPSPKKRKKFIAPQTKSDAVIQAEFCRAVVELQIAGLLRMPTKRRPDYVQRVAFGL